MLLRRLPVVEASAVDKVGVLHAQLRRPLVHPGHEGLLAAGHMLGQGAGAVVGRGDHDGLEHLPQGELLPDLEIDLAAALGRRGLRGRHHVVPADAALIQGLHHQQQRHHLGHAGRGQLFMVVFFKEHRPRGLLDQNCRGGGLRQVRSLDGDRRQRQQQYGQQAAEQAFLHHRVILSSGFLVRAYAPPDREMPIPHFYAEFVCL